jgi:hypothetical protein
MPSTPYIITDEQGNKFDVHIHPDRRLKKSARWTRREGNEIVLRIPYRMSKQNLEKLLADVTKQVSKMQKRIDHRTDEDLQERALHLNKRYFSADITWASIRWVANMNNRLGSCTNGGPTDGQIRISERIRDWPQWVIDYVIVHELTHRQVANHGPDFWALLRSAFPQTDRALGFIDGVSFAHNESINGGAEEID